MGRSGLQRRRVVNVYRVEIPVGCAVDGCQPMLQPARTLVFVVADPTLTSAPAAVATSTMMSVPSAVMLPETGAASEGLVLFGVLLMVFGVLVRLPEMLGKRRSR